MVKATENQLSIVEQLKGVLTDIKDKINKGGISNTVFGELSTNAKVIQDKLNELLQKKGLLTQSDINDAYVVLQEQQKKVLEQQSKKEASRVAIYVLVGVLLIGGIYIYTKRKK
jgi:hypothetical protein